MSFESFETTRRTIGIKWYSFDLPGGGHAGVRYHGLRDWGVYFRDYRGKAIDPTPLGGDELRPFVTYDDAVRRIAEFLKPPRGTFTLDQLDPVLETDLIGYRVAVDQVAKVMHPDAGQRFRLELDNLTQSEAKLALDTLRRAGRLT